MWDLVWEYTEQSVEVLSCTEGQIGASLMKMWVECWELSLGVRRQIINSGKEKEKSCFRIPSVWMTAEVLKLEPASEFPRVLVETQVIGLHPSVSDSVGVGWKPAESAYLTSSQVVLMLVARASHSKIP